jgi:hypothetical protein
MLEEQTNGYTVFFIDVKRFVGNVRKWCDVLVKYDLLSLSTETPSEPTVKFSANIT